MTGRRPFLNTVARYTWREKNGTEVPGIILNHGRIPAAHLTPAEAYDLANTLTDLAEQIEQETTK